MVNSFTLIHRGDAVQQIDEIQKKTLKGKLQRNYLSFSYKRNKNRRSTKEWRRRL